METIKVFNICPGNLDRRYREEGLREYNGIRLKEGYKHTIDLPFGGEEYVSTDEQYSLDLNILERRRVQRIEKIRSAISVAGMLAVLVGGFIVAGEFRISTLIMLMICAFYVGEFLWWLTDDITTKISYAIGIFVCVIVVVVIHDVVWPILVRFW